MSEAIMEMPRYQSHKIVHALKIAGIARNIPEEGCESDGGAFIHPSEEGYEPFYVDFAYMSKHKPEVGGYYVEYGDGYKSFSPAAAFEEGYTRI